MKQYFVLDAFIVFVAAGAARANSITVDGDTYKGAYIRRSPSTYYIQPFSA